MVYSKLGNRHCCILISLSFLGFADAVSVETDTPNFPSNIPLKGYILTAVVIALISSLLLLPDKMRNQRPPLCYHTPEISPFSISKIWALRYIFLCYEVSVRASHHPCPFVWMLICICSICICSIVPMQVTVRPHKYIIGTKPTLKSWNKIALFSQADWREAPSTALQLTEKSRVPWGELFPLGLLLTR